MATGTIIAVWKDAVLAHAAVAVTGDAPAVVEYQGSTPLLDGTGAAKSLAQLKIDLTAAVKAQRDAALSAVTTPVGGIAGVVTL